jgi:uncharacterized protein involved in outer membrane biogenesis
MLGVGGLIVAALFAALLVPFFVDWSSFRVSFEEQASRLLGKKVSVHGTVDARLLPFPSVTLHDVQIGQDVDGAPLMQVARFSMDMELAPFLSGQAHIFDMRIEEPKGRIRILKDGTLAWMRGSPASISGASVIIEDVHVSGGNIDLIDDQTGQTRHVTGLAASLSAGSLLGPWRGEGRAALDGHAGSFSLTSGAANGALHSMPLRLRIRPDAQPVEVNFDGNLASIDNRLAYKGSFDLAILDPPADGLRGSQGMEPSASTASSQTMGAVSAPKMPGPRVKGSFELTNERIRVPDYRLEAGPVNDPYVVTGEATLDTGTKPEFLLTADGQQIDVNRLDALAGQQGKTGRNPAASAQRRIDAFIRMAASIPIPQVPGRASLKLPAIVINDTTIRDIRLDLRPSGNGWTVDNGVATLPGRTQLEAKGAMVLKDKISFVGTMLVASNQPSGLADWLSGHVDPAIRQLRTAGLSAKVDFTPQLQRFDDLELSIGGATLKGRLERQSGTGLPALDIDLAGDAIDIDAMRALASLVTGGDAGQEALDHRVTAKLKADRFSAFGVTASKVDTAFTIAEGALSLDHLDIGNVEGASLAAKGRMEGSLLAYTGSGQVRLRAKDPGAFFAMLQARLPHHPALDRLAASAAWYADTDLTADASADGATNGLKVSLKGKANGSAIDATLGLPGLFDLTAPTDLSLSASLSNPEGSVVLGQAGLDPLPFDADGAGKLALSVDPGRGGPAKTALRFSTPKTNFDLTGALDLSGERFGEGTAHVSLKSADIEPYLVLFGIGLPQFGSGLPTHADADLALSGTEIKASNIRGDVADNHFSGAIGMPRTGKATAAAPSASGSLAIDDLDLAWLSEALFGPVTDPATGAYSKKPFGRPLFGATDLALDVKAGTFTAGQLGAIGDFSGKVGYRSGGITVENAAGRWHGGSLSGRLMMSNGEGTGILQAKLAGDQVDLGDIVWKRAGAPTATGKASFTMALETTGRSIDEIMHSATGSGALKLSGLSIEGVNPGLFAPLLGNADKLQGDITAEKVRPLVAGLVRQGAAAIGSVTIPFNIGGGEVRVQNVQAAAGPVKLSGEGRFDPVDDVIDADLAMTFDPGEDKVAGGDPTLSLAYGGRLSAPTERIDVGAISNFLSMRHFEQERRRVETLQASVLEKQRLRREVAYYNAVAADRQAARLKAEADEKARQAAAAAAERQRLDAEAAAAKAQQPAAGDAGQGNANDGSRSGQSGSAQPLAPFQLPPMDNQFTAPVPGAGGAMAPGAAGSGAGGGALPGVQR